LILAFFIIGFDDHCIVRTEKGQLKKSGTGTYFI